MIDSRTYGEIVKVQVEIHDNCKYEKGSKPVALAEYSNLEWWEIVNGEDAINIELDLDKDEVDPYHEYLVLHLENGETATYRNSFVDMFRMY